MDLDTEIASKMLTALMDTDTPVKIVPRLSIDEQKHYLKKYIDTVSVADRRDIGNVLVVNGKQNALRSCSEGVIINLDILPAADIEQMYALLVFKKTAK